MQLTYSIDMAVAREGQLADAGTWKDVASFKATAAAVYIGKVVTKGTDDIDVVHPSTAAGVSNPLLVRGIVLHTHETESRRDGLAANYPIASVVPVLRKGRAWVVAKAAATESTSNVNVYWNGATQKGTLSGSSDTTQTAVLPKSRWITSSSGADGLAVVELDL